MKNLTELMNNIDSGKYTGRETILAGAVLLLGGLVVGMLISPRKKTVIGSHNGNGSGNGNRADAGKEKNSKVKIESEKA